ncbi:YcnI family protein [Streptomyces sp. NBC_00078]|uniref:YcnI family copper-binding membrane protein n=1 Tax=unclassified Streptomyces TaxID=2593676 RepID=UPI00224EFBAB|nr:YcnI family protein [Streptomyces sp. NBC_00078]MCX5424328.1 YcnI family protein [Streptomyces sp. NBC_00078]
MSTARTALRRAGVVTALAAAGVLTAAGVASAHVTVHPDSYAKGATDGVLSFRVPNEEDTASTTKVQVFLPTDHPVLGVLVSPPQSGWTAKVTNTKLKTPVKTDDGTITDAVSEITWTGGKIGAGQYQDFNVAFGQLPDNTDQLTFKTLQTYSDGKTVRWIEEAQSGGDEPENPAPVLKLTAKGAEEGGTPAASAKASNSSGSAGSPASASAGSSDSTARGLGVAGLVVGVLGLAAAAFALVRNRSNRAE